MGAAGTAGSGHGGAGGSGGITMTITGNFFLNQID